MSLLYKFSKIRSRINVTAYQECGPEFLLFNNVVLWKFLLAFYYRLPHLLKVDLKDFTMCVRKALKPVEGFIKNDYMERNPQKNIFEGTNGRGVENGWDQQGIC